MNSEKYIITTLFGNSSQTQIWDSSAPMGIGHPLKWVIENTDSGIRIRKIPQEQQTLNRAKLIQVDFETIKLGDLIPLEPKRKSAIRITRVTAPIPSFTSNYPSTYEKKEQASEIHVFRGVRRTVISSEPVHSAYVAYLKGKPLFTFSHDSTGIRIKALLNGVRVKQKGRSPFSIILGDSYQIKREALQHTTIYRNWHWWRFNTTHLTPAALTDVKEENHSSRLVMLSWFLIVLGLITAVICSTLIETVETKKPEEKTPPPQQVKLVFRKKEFLPPLPPVTPPPEPKITPDVKLGSTKPVSPQKTSNAPVVSAAAPAAPAPQHATTPPAPIAPKHPSGPAPETTISQHPATPTHAPPPMAPAPSGATAAHHPEHPSLPPPPVDNAPKKPTSAEIAAEQARKLREAFGGVSSQLKEKNAFHGSTSSNTTKDLFSSSNVNTSPTQVSTHFSGSNMKVGELGGQGIKHASGNQSGYGTSAVTNGSGNSNDFITLGGPNGSTDGISMSDNGLTMEEVGAVIHAHYGEVRYCHEVALVAIPRTEGRIVLAFKINENGVVQSANIDKSTLDPASTLGECIRTRLLNWKFPKPRGGGTVSVSYPFVFRLLEKK